MNITANYRGYDPNGSTGRLLIRGSTIKDADPLVLWLHGLGGTADQANIDDYTDDLVRALAQDVQVLSLDAGGTATWGNDASTDEVSTERGLAATNYGAGASVPVIGYSMGAAVATNFARRFPAQVSRLLLIAPALDIDFHYDNGSQGTKDEIDAAYGGSWATNGASTHNPVDFAASLSGIPVEIHYGTSDTNIRQAAISTFATAHGNTDVVSYTGVDHIQIFGEMLTSNLSSIVGFLTT